MTTSSPAALYQTDAALQDALQKWGFIAASDERAADRMIDRLTASAKPIARVRGIGTARETLGEGVRSFSVGSYVIYFRRDLSCVTILRILHGARGVRRLLSG